jgi:hypothetical protein
MFGTPAKSPDIPPVENLCARAKVKVAENCIYNDEEDLRLAISGAWIEIREIIDYARNLVNSIPNRFQAIIVAKGGHTKY